MIFSAPALQHFNSDPNTRDGIHPTDPSDPITAYNTDLK